MGSGKKTFTGRSRHFRDCTRFPDRTAPEHCRYDTCIVLIDHKELRDDSVRETVLPGGDYAVFKIRHTAEDIQRALLSKGYRIADKPVMERYALEQLHVGYCELCVPLG
ncbi:GyrI-like domain-containing protein [Peribacillus sp. NPDC056705]|uniref:GyrI-like domain-containing protein n=1 Tax=Peribacillus sp. NPDC056705 TaxID=3345918 RepID=UPI003747B29A